MIYFGGNQNIGEQRVTDEIIDVSQFLAARVRAAPPQAQHLCIQRNIGPTYIVHAYIPHYVHSTTNTHTIMFTYVGTQLYANTQKPA